MESVEKTITDFTLKSINDDNTLRELVNKQDNRITALETTNKTLKWTIGIGFTAFGTILTALAFAILTSIWLNTQDVLIFALAFMLSLLVLENRIESKIHSLAETIFGSFMGVLIVLLIYGLAILNNM